MDTFRLIIKKSSIVNFQHFGFESCTLIDLLSNKDLYLQLIRLDVVAQVEYILCTEINYITLL